MRFSLIVATLGRKEEVRDLLTSLTNQTFKDFEVIIIDQNNDGKIDAIVSSFSKLLIINHIKSVRPGLSFNRNIGLKQAQGEIVAFPDDDCTYDYDVLKKVDMIYRTCPKSELVLTQIADPVSRQIYLESKKANVSRNDLMKYSISFNFFIRNQSNMSFDIRLGVGARFGSGEESDFLWEYLQEEDLIMFADTIVYHPLGSVSYRSKEKLYSYGLGWGAVYKKEIFQRKNYAATWGFLKGLFRSFGGAIIKMNSAYLLTLKGRIIGFALFPINQ